MIKLKLAEIAKKIGKNASDIARETGINRNTVNTLMGEEIDDLRFSTIEKICSTYNLNISDILDFSVQKIENKIPSKIYRQEGSIIPFTCWPWEITVNNQSKEFFDFGFGDFRAYYKEQYGWIYWDHDSLYKLSKYVYDKYGENEKINKIYSVFKIQSKLIEDIYHRADINLISDSSDELLINYFNSLWKAYENFWKNSVFIDSFDPGLDHEEINKLAKQYNFTKDEVGVLTTPTGMTFNNERLLALLYIVDKLRKKKIPKEKLDVFLEKYVKEDYEVRSYIRSFDYYKSTYSYIRPITDIETVHEIKKYLNDESLFKKEFNDLKNYHLAQTEAISKILKSHKLKKNPLYFFNLLTFWREERKKINLMGIYVLDMILQVIEQRTGISKKYLQYLSYEEIPGVIKGLVTKSTLERRYKDGVLIEFYGKGGYKIIDGNEAVSIRDEIEKNLSGGENLKTFGGQTACQGYAKGIARIVLDQSDFGKFKEGEILVTGMTRPEFVPLMKMAAGIITNEGGITCHAAIVSRELGKPCIIGTKIATQAIKDGDLVEVRGNHNTIRILN